jgi:hypothetical protein
MEGEIYSNTRSMEVRMSDSTTCKVGERCRLRPGLGMWSITVVVGNMCGGGMCIVCRMSWRRRAKDRRLLGSKPEPKNWRGNVVSIVRSLVLSLSRAVGRDLVVRDLEFGVWQARGTCQRTFVVDVRRRSLV